MKILIQHIINDPFKFGLLLNLRDKYGLTPLHSSARMLILPQQFTHKRGINKDDPIAHIWHQKEKILKKFLYYSKTIQLNMNDVDYSNYTILHYYVQSYLQVVGYFPNKENLSNRFVSIIDSLKHNGKFLIQFLFQTNNQKVQILIFKMIVATQRYIKF